MTMNIWLIIAFVLGGGTVFVDHQICKLPHWLAVILFSAAVILFVVGMIVRQNNLTP